MWPLKIEYIHMKYYYLIATLPDLSLEETKVKFDFDETLETISRNLEKEDELLLRYLLYPNDHKNLLNAIFHRHHHLPAVPFLKPAVFEEEIIEDYPHQQYTFPDYIADFLDDFQERFSEMSMREIENQLLQRFYQAVASAKDGFILDYFDFERILRSMITGFNRGLYPFKNPLEMVEEENISSRLAQEGVGVSLLAKAHPFIESLQQALVSKDPMKLEKTVDGIRWDFIDNFNWDFFGRQQVYGYVLKLLMVKRWAWLEEQQGEQHFERLCQQIRSSALTKTQEV